MSPFLIHIFIKNQPTSLAKNSFLHSWSIYSSRINLPHQLRTPVSIPGQYIHTESTYLTSQELLSPFLVHIFTKNQPTSPAKNSCLHSWSIYSPRINLPHQPRTPVSIPGQYIHQESTYLTSQELLPPFLVNIFIKNQPTSLAKNSCLRSWSIYSSRINLPHQPRTPVSIPGQYIHQESTYLTSQELLSPFLVHIFIKNQPTSPAKNSCLHSWSIYSPRINLPHQPRTPASIPGQYIHQESTYLTSQELLPPFLLHIFTKNQPTSPAKNSCLHSWSIYSPRINLPHQPRTPASIPSPYIHQESTYLTSQELLPPFLVNIFTKNQPTSPAKNSCLHSWSIYSPRINLPHQPRTPASIPGQYIHQESTYLTSQELLSPFLIHIFTKNQPTSLAKNSCLHSWSIYSSRINLPHQPRTPVSIPGPYIHQESTYLTSQELLPPFLVHKFTKNQPTSPAKNSCLHSWSIYSSRINLPH